MGRAVSRAASKLAIREVQRSLPLGLRWVTDTARLSTSAKLVGANKGLALREGL